MPARVKVASVVSMATVASRRISFARRHAVGARVASPELVCLSG